MNFLYFLIFLIIFLWLFNKLCLWLESKGWLYYKHQKPQSGLLGSALQELNAQLLPSHRHAVVAKQEKCSEQKEKAEEDNTMANQIEDKEGKTWNVHSSSEEVIEFIDNTLGAFNRTQVKYTSKMDYIPLNYHIKDESGLIIAGINAFTCWQMVYISEFWIDSAYRNQGIGSKLLKKIEDEAKSRGATASHTDTFDWQAKDFYLKQGYEVFGTIENCPPGHSRFFLKKHFL